MKKHFFVLAAVIFSSTIYSQLVLSTRKDSSGIFLDEVILTSNKYPKKQSETGKVFTVITREQLDRSGGKSLGELLNSVAGTTIIGANNNLGTNLTASIRGSSAGNVLILLDGIPINDPSVITNYFDLNFLNPDQIERIEIVKGGQSTLYGSDAVAGVINIISKQAGANKINVTGNLSAGSYNTWKQSAGISGQAKKTDYTLNYTHISSSGFSAANDSSHTGNFDNDGFKQQNLSVRFGIKAGKKLKINLSGTYNKYKTDLDEAAFTDDGDYTANNDYNQAGAGAVYTLKNGLLHFNYYYNRTERDYLNDSQYVSNPYVTYSKSNYVGRTHYTEFYGNWKFNQWEILIGTDYRFNNTDQSYWSTGSFGPYEQPLLKAKMDQISSYGSLVFTNKHGFNLEAGSRFNIHSEYGNNLSFTFNPSYLIRKKTKIFGNFYSAFKTPTLFQLFDPLAGNTELKPEKGIIGEAGIELYSVKSFHGRMVGFWRNTNNAIVYTYNPANYASKYLNASKQINYGVELETSYFIKKISFTANYTYTDGKITSAFDGTGSPLGKDTTYYNLYRIPEHTINLGASMQATKSIFSSFSLHVVSKREEFVYGLEPATLKSYALFDFYSEYKWCKQLKFFIDLKNIFNKKYVEFMGYNTRRFNFVTGLRFSF